MDLLTALIECLTVLIEHLYLWWQVQQTFGRAWVLQGLLLVAMPLDDDIQVQFLLCFLYAGTFIYRIGQKFGGRKVWRI